LQYDAAANETVARQLAPNSQVAGRATVFVFPDLNTGNTTHKAVQRSADCVSLGPMLQGLRKPVNDLPRGAQVDDIVYTIALTAIKPPTDLWMFKCWIFYLPPCAVSLLRCYWHSIRSCCAHSCSAWR
jgi:phosphotransacetylase